MLWPEQGLTFTFCRERVCHLKWATGESLDWADQHGPRGLLKCLSIFQGALRKSTIGLNGDNAALTPS